MVKMVFKVIGNLFMLGVLGLWFAMMGDMAGFLGASDGVAMLFLVGPMVLAAVLIEKLIIQ